MSAPEVPPGLPLVAVPLDVQQIQLLLLALGAAHGPGYSSDPLIARTQAALSIGLELADRLAQARRALESALAKREDGTEPA